MQRALVIGSNGQDGSLLSRRLVALGYQVLGVGRQERARYALSGQFRYAQVDLERDGESFSSLLREFAPTRIYHLAAVHASASGSSSGLYETVFPAMLRVNAESVQRSLEYMRTHNREARFGYASSAKAFGAPLPEAISEATPRVTTCLYSLTKNAAGDLVEYYRKQHGLLASQLFLFNHESELRPENFFIPKIVRLLRALEQKQVVREPVETLGFYCDWGSADEYMELMTRALEEQPGTDFVVATGTTSFARDVVSRLVAQRGHELSACVSERSPGGGRLYHADVTRIASLLRRPQTSIEALINRLVAGQSTYDFRG